MSIDRVSRHFENASRFYKINHNISGELNPQQQYEVSLLAGNHIGVFYRWILEKGFSTDTNPDTLRVISGDMSGTEYLLLHHGGELKKELISKDAFPFVDEYYCHNNYYFGDYVWCCIDTDDKDLYCVISGNEDYDKLKVRIDDEYKEYNERGGHICC